MMCRNKHILNEILPHSFSSMNQSEETFYIVPEGTHNTLVRTGLCSSEGLTRRSAEAAARFSSYATHHGIRTHNALKALHLDDLFGSKAGGM